MKYYLYNPKSNNSIKTKLEEHTYLDVTKLNYQEFINNLNKEDEIVLVGGDGTLNYFINHLDCENIKNNIYFYGNGSGNDFLNDIGEPVEKEVLINKYIEKLPKVTIEGNNYKFVNGVGLGYDAWVCKEVELSKQKNPYKKINYTNVAIKGILFGYSTCHVNIKVDGKEYEFDNVWLSPVMKGKFFGGGMKVAPGQKRDSDELTLVVYVGKSKLRILIALSKVFEGEHVKYKDIVKIITGKKFDIKLSRNVPAQIDGEVIENVCEYHVEV